jgi:putative oxidoreductase
MRLRRLFLVRLLAGGVFWSEGIQKFLYPAELAAGRFAKIGVPAPQIMGRLLVYAKCLAARW